MLRKNTTNTRHSQTTSTRHIFCSKMLKVSLFRTFEPFGFFWKKVTILKVTILALEISFVKYAGFCLQLNPSWQLDSWILIPADFSLGQVILAAQHRNCSIPLLVFVGEARWETAVANLETYVRPVFMVRSSATARIGPCHRQMQLGEQTATFITRILQEMSGNSCNLYNLYTE